ncbi:MAG: AAA family ATPase [Actinocrinis sp.]
MDGDLSAIERLNDGYRRSRKEMSKSIVGQERVLEELLIAIFARGHCLLVGVPGLAKTLLVRTIAQVFKLRFQRIQFTPDLMPADITGTEILEETGDGRRRMQFVKGPIFANVILADEINRTPPKTQSAMLECMEERQVTVDGTTYVLEAPFMVIATQNPIEMEGTYPLPEAQRDRFMARIAMGYPAPAAELRMLDGHSAANPLDELVPVAGTHDLIKLIEAVRNVHVAEDVKRYVIDLVSATRAAGDLRLGASPRAALHLVRAARAKAALEDRDFVLPDDIKTLAVPVLAHRLIPTAEARVARRSPEQIVTDLLEQVPVDAQASRRTR